MTPWTALGLSVRRCVHLPSSVAAACGQRHDMTLTTDLLSLFRIDSQVRGLRRRLDSASSYLDAQNMTLNELRQQHDEIQLRRRHVQATIGNLEGEVAVIDERVEKLRGELNVATTNKQYTAVLTELNTAKLARSELEDRILQEMETVEECGRQLETVAGEKAERTKVRAIAEAKLKQRHDEVGKRLAELEQQRITAADCIPGTDLKLFDDLAEAYDGEAVTPVEEIDRRRREYVCGSCNLNLPFEAVAALLGRGDTLVVCPACGRILFLEDDTRVALAKK